MVPAAQHLERSPSARMLTDGKTEVLETWLSEANASEMMNLFFEEFGKVKFPGICKNNVSSISNENENNKIEVNTYKHRRKNPVGLFIVSGSQNFDEFYSISIFFILITSFMKTFPLRYIICALHSLPS